MTVNGVPLKKGHLVVFPIWYLHHQPDVWPDPHKFDPLRFVLICCRVITVKYNEMVKRHKNYFSKYLA